jgi:pectate lyase
MNSMGNGYKGTTGDVLYLKSNKTIIGITAGITVKCSWQIINSSNIIIRNLQLEGPGNSNSQQNWDCVNIQGSKRIWVDHCVVLNGEDGNFDIVKGSDNISVTWCIFTYTAPGDHNLSNLIGSSDDESISHNKLNTSYINCWWKDVADRCPRTRYGKIHMVNCLYSRPNGFPSSNGTAAGLMANNRVENCHFIGITNPCKIIGTPSTANCTPIACKFTSCSGTTTGGSMGGLSVFTPPYEYQSWMVTADNVKAQVEKLAGNTLTNPLNCGSVVYEDCAGIVNGTATLDNCSRCIGGTTGKVACSAVGEAETDACTYNGTIDSSNIGFKGKGYINVTNAIGAEILLYIYAATTGSKTLSFRYANGGTADRTAMISPHYMGVPSMVDEMPVMFSFPPTGSFTTYKTVEFTLGLQVGITSIRLTAYTAEGLANIDQIGYVSTGISAGSCSITSIEASGTEQPVSIYPNPSRGGFLVNLAKAVNIQVFDMEGRLQEEHKNVSKMELGEHLKPGIYFLKTDSKVYKLIKE